LDLKKWTKPDKKKGEENVDFMLDEILKIKKKHFRQKLFSTLKSRFSSPFFLSGLVHFFWNNVFVIF
jgi:hypothetical protein